MLRWWWLWVAVGCTSTEQGTSPAAQAGAAEEWPFYGPPPRELGLVEVNAPRELRGLWVATVSNLDFPSRPGLSDAALKRELLGIVKSAGDLGYNTLVFQVRPEADALYASKLEPWSRVLSGRQGKGPGFDPLDYLVGEAHARGIEVHAWFNPFRAATVRGVSVAPNHISKWGSKFVRPWGGSLWLDPGEPQVTDHALKVIEDVLVRYDIDGIHLDDYFYPYPDGNRSFPDDASYAAYKKRGGTLSKDLWRRSNVDNMVRRLAEIVQRKRPEVRFGISPFGIYRPGKPAGVRGLDQVAVLHADPLKWFGEGWVDYLAPQLYWPTTAPLQRYDKLVAWWNDQVTAERPLLVGLDVTKVGREAKWTLAEIRKQVELSRAQTKTAGQIWFRATPVLKNQAGLGKLVGELYAKPALPPPLPRLNEAVDPPRVAVHERELRIDVSDRKKLKGFFLYRRVGEGWEPHLLLGPQTEEVEIAPGTWALSAVSRTGVESLGVELVVSERSG